MNVLFRILAVVGVAAALICFNAQRGPTIQRAGKAVAIRDAAYQPNPNKQHKIVFSLRQGSAKPADVNPGLNALARAVNLYTGAGVPLSKLDFVGVAYGDAATALLDNAHYRERFGVDNPNIPLLTELRNAGVDVAVCSQSLLAHQFQPEWTDPHVTTALSAITTIAELQEHGYSLMPM